MLSELNGEEEGTFTDERDGKVYKTVKIGNQVWMAENLNYAGEDGELGKCYNNNPENGEKYGRLYTWEQAMKAAPDGWHLPSKEEWDVLINSVSGKSMPDGLHLQAKIRWKDIDNFGVSALLSGRGHIGGYFHDIGLRGYWWSSTKSDDTIFNDSPVSLRVFNYNLTNWQIGGKGSLLSIRCIKD